MKEVIILLFISYMCTYLRVVMTMYISNTVVTKVHTLGIFT